VRALENCNKMFLLHFAGSTFDQSSSQELGFLDRILQGQETYGPCL